MKMIMTVFEAMVLTGCSLAAGWRLLHYFQLESYQLPGYWRSIRRNVNKALLPPLALSALGVADYMLPDTVEPRTPIGVKLVFETWSAEDGEACVRVRLIYQSTEQLRGIIPLSLENPPMSYDVDFTGLERNADGYYRLDDVMGRLQSAIDAYDALVEEYGDENAELDAAA